MPKTMPKPSPEQADKAIAAVVSKGLDAALATSKTVGKVFGLSPDEAAAAFNKAVDAWAEKN